MIRSKGEAGTGDIVEAVRHLRMIRGEIRRLATLDARASWRPPPRSCGAPLHLVRQVAADGRLPVVLFCAGGIATPADAVAGHAARRRGRVRRLGHLQVRGSRAPAPARSSRRPRTTAIPRASPPPRPASASRWSASRPPSSSPSSCSPRAAGSAADRALLPSAILALQGDFEAHAKILRALGAEPREVRVPGRPRGPRRADHPRRRVDGDDARDRARGAGRAAAGAGRAPARRCSAPAPGMIMLDRDHLGVLDIARRAQRVRAPAALLRGRPRARRRRRRARCTRCSSARRGSAEHGDGVEVLAEVDGHPVAVRQGNVLAVAFHPELAGETPAARAAAGDWPLRRGDDQTPCARARSA